MRKSQYLREAESLLKKEESLTVADFKAIWPEVPMPTVYSRIRVLMTNGKLSQVGRGRYIAVYKPKYEPRISESMRSLNHWMVEECVGINHCVYERDGNLYVEASRKDIPQVKNSLCRYSPKVILQKDAVSFPSTLEGYIIVGPLVSDAPLTMEDNISIPTLEKMLVDSFARKGMNSNKRQFSFQKAMEVYPVNINRMKRYAARKGVKDELSVSLALLDTGRIKMITATQRYLAGIPVLRAWVFGSFARGEETSESDLDLLVDYDYSNGISLLDIIRYRMELKELIGRDVDLIENGYLRPFAVASAERDKYLVYER